VPWDAALAPVQAGLEELRLALATLQVEVGGLQARLLNGSLDGQLRQAVALRVEPLLEQVQELLTRIEAERDEVTLSAEERRDLVARYKPGQVELLRQKVEALEAEVAAQRERLRKKDERIDELERIEQQLRSETGRLDRQQLEQMRTEIAQEKSRLEDVRALEAERDNLSRLVHQYQLLEGQYRQHQDAVRKDEELRLRNQQLEDDNQRLDEEVRRLRQGQDRLRQAVDRARTTAEERREQLQTAERERDEERRRAEEAEGQVVQFTEESQATAQERRELLRERTELQRRQADLQREQAAAQQQMLRQWEQERQSLRDQEAARFAPERTRLLQETERLRAERDGDSAELEEARRLLHHARREQQAWQEDEAGRQRRRAQLQEDETHLHNRCQQLHEEASSLDAELARRRGEEERQWQSRLGELHRQLEEARGTIQGVQAQLARFQQLRDEERQRYEEYRRERQQLQERTGRRERLRAVRRPYFRDALPLRSDAVSEADWLAELGAKIERAQFHFSPRLLEAFHTSLKISSWAPFTVLSGVSGTGKSELPRLYAHLGGLRFLSVPVQPNWDSPQDLFGFFNYADGRYKATNLLNAMVQSQRPRQEGGFEDALLLVLLDEMNLARIELYCSELLSRLESRRNLRPGGGTGEDLMPIDIGSDAVPFNLRLGRNILFVGTMNEDETTQTLSDKVLDRGNLLAFPRPRQLRSRQLIPVEPGDALLPDAVWRGWVVEPQDDEHGLPAAERKRLGEALRRVNDGLAEVNGAIGHRVLQAIESYVANHPRVRAARLAGRAIDEACGRAFEDQFVQKIMPKLRGIEVNTEAGERCLDAVQRVLDTSAPALLPDFRRAREAMHGSFLWTSADYLEKD
jgi:hypothetical protein